MTTSTTAPSRSPRAPRPLGTALRTVLRGVSQIFFLENSLSGALILGALALMHPRGGGDDGTGLRHAGAVLGRPAPRRDRGRPAGPGGRAR
ncbi:urea transporter [Micrococcus luteus]|nr:urea transporter [Micrococcus luteus]